jgi:hypothetical protein
MKHYRVMCGYGKDDFISIDETELKKAIIAQGTGRVVLLSEGSIAGNEIKRILPDYQRDMGWNRDYTLGGEDYEAIGASKMREYIQLQRNTELEIEGKPREIPKEISAGVKQLAESKRV